MRGLFVVFEGLDRSGKTTQSARLARTLSNCIKLNFPDRSTTVGGLINSYLQGASHIEDHAVHLLFSANRWELNTQLTSLLDQGTNVVVDRYAYSGVSYSAAKGLDAAWCKACDTGLLKPDLVIYLKMTPEEAASRGDYGAERYERLDFQRVVETQFNEMLLGQSHVLVLDANLEEDSLASLVTDAVNALLTQERRTPGHLWS
jgi:dTMP kinase